MARKNTSRNDRSRSGAQVDRRSVASFRGSPVLSNATLKSLAYGRTFKPLAASPRRFDQSGRRLPVSPTRSEYSSSQKVISPAPIIGARDEKRRDARTCKSRPTNTKGTGGSRPYVPWCDRKK